jgi:hypothetical protein
MTGGECEEVELNERRPATVEAPRIRPSPSLITTIVPELSVDTMGYYYGTTGTVAALTVVGLCKVAPEAKIGHC